MNTKITRTRYAPSPTGNLHIGGARTALFAYLHAKSNNGEFILRLEDTDLARNIKEGEKNQIEGLSWLGIKPDYDPNNSGEIGPLRQSERLEIYQKYIDFLLEKDLAYYSWHTPEDIENEIERQIKNGIERPMVKNDFFRSTKEIKGVKPSIRVKVPDNVLFEWNDGVRGKMSVPSSAVTDWVIQKSDGIPTYNFANVIDDHLMEITDVHRGEEHISNTPKQIHLYKLFEWDIPNFYHLTIIINDDGKKLSKRDESVLQFIHLYKELGFLPHSVFNFLSLLGWSPGGSESENEIFSHDKLIKIFDTNRFSKAPSKFDINKLKWMNNIYIQKLNDEETFNFLDRFVEDVELIKEQKQIIFKSFKPGIHQGEEIIKLIEIFTEKIEFNNDDLSKLTTSKNLLKEVRERLINLKDWDNQLIKEVIIQTGKELELKGKELHFPIRFATTLRNHGPEIAKILEIFGKEKTLERLKIYEEI